MMEAHGHQAKTHLAVEDATGDSAIIEVNAGVLTTHHDRRFTVFTNAPFKNRCGCWVNRTFPSPTIAVPLTATSTR